MFSQSTTLKPWADRSRVWLSAGLIAALLALSACSSAPQELQTRIAIEDIERPTERPVLPDPAPIQTRRVEWQVVTPDTLPEGNDWVLFSMTAKDYENLAKTMADTIRWVKEAKWRLQYYRGETDVPAEPVK